MPKAPIKEFKKTIEYYFIANQLDPLKSDLLAKEVLYFSNKIPIDDLKEYLATNFDQFYVEGWQNLLLFPSIEAHSSYANYLDTPDVQGNIRGFSRYLLPDKFITTVDAKMPIIDSIDSIKQHTSTHRGYISENNSNAVGGIMIKESMIKTAAIIFELNDYDIGINYNREYINIKLHKDNEVINFNNLFTIAIDPITSEDLEAYLIQHYQSFFSLGIISLRLNEDTSELDASYIKDFMTYKSNEIMAIESIGVATL